MAITRPSYSGAPERPFECSAFDFHLHMIPNSLTQSSEDEDEDEYQDWRRSFDLPDAPLDKLEQLKLKAELDVMGSIAHPMLEKSLSRRGWEMEEELSYVPCFGEEFEQIPATFNSKRY